MALAALLCVLASSSITEASASSVRAVTPTSAYVYLDRSGSYSVSTSKLKGDFARGTGCFANSTAALKAASTQWWREGGCSGLVAWASWVPSLKQTGFDELSLETSAAFDDRTQAYAAGFLEGTLSHKRMWGLLQLLVRQKKPEPAFVEFLRLQDAWLREQVQKFAPSSATQPAATEEQAYWYNVALVLRQLDGMLAGYNARASSSKQMTLMELWQLNDDGDKTDIERAIAAAQEAAKEKAAAALKAAQMAAPAPEVTATIVKTETAGVPRFQQMHADDVSSLETLASRFPPLAVKAVADMTREELMDLVGLNGHCSALIKLTADDVIVGHATWSDYSTLMRIFKSYRFAFHHPSIRNGLVEFTSYPGFLWSSDDFYRLSGFGDGVANLVILETTLTILDESLYTQFVRPNGPGAGVMSWVRATVANRVAATARQWVDSFKQWNSGTYNNQWMVLDMGLIEAARQKRALVRTSSPQPPLTLPAESFWVLEQIPGSVEVRDMTPSLQSQGYFASYNLPLFKSINEKSQFVKYSGKLNTEELQYAASTRARIFAAEQNKAQSVAAMETMMRFNDYLSADSLTKGCPANAIAARYDLPPRAGAVCENKSLKLNGAIDGKVTSASMIAASSQTGVAMRLVSGPTNQAVPRFDWSNSAADPKELVSMRSVQTATRFEFAWAGFGARAIPKPTPWRSLLKRRFNKKRVPVVAAAKPKPAAAPAAPAVKAPAVVVPATTVPAATPAPVAAAPAAVPAGKSSPALQPAIIVPAGSLSGLKGK